MSLKRDWSPNELACLRLAESTAINEAIQHPPKLVSVISDIAHTIIGAYRSGHKVLLCGNGGSAVCELVEKSLA